MCDCSICLSMCVYICIHIGNRGEILKTFAFCDEIMRQPCVRNCVVITEHRHSCYVDGSHAPS